MPVHDISLPISESLVIWPGDPEIHITHPFHLDKGDPSTVSQIHMGVHAGTHVDAPAHFIPGGAGIEAVPLSILIGKALVVDVFNVDMLSADSMAGLHIPEETERVLFHTKNSSLWQNKHQEFVEKYVAVTEDGAEWLATRGIKLVGTDYLSIAPFTESVSIHHILLEKNIVVVEGLDLNGIVAGFYQLVCLPLRLVGCEGAPARAVLLDLEG